MRIAFSWDQKKNLANRIKHNVSFEEAETVFYDANALLIEDPEHSTNEDRFVILGMSAKLRMLVVCHCYRENDNIIRIISARKTNKNENNQYKENIIC